MIRSRKAVLIALIAVVGVVCMLTVSFAAEAKKNVKDEDSSYAYMPLEDAEPELQKKILKARENIIFSTSWSADEATLYIERNDGTVEQAPKFSELFPGWDIPETIPDQELDDSARILNADEWK